MATCDSYIEATPAQLKALTTPPQSRPATVVKSKRRLRALVEAVGHDLVFWCPNCKGQILRVTGQVALPKLALAEVKHINECKAM